MLVANDLSAALAIRVAAEEFGLARPDARLVLLRDAALLPNEERSQACNQVLTPFLARTGH